MTTEAHKAALVKVWQRINQRDLGRPKPEGTNPMECAALSYHDVAQEQRIDCVRRPECLTHAVKLAWPAFSCGECSVRDEVRPRARTRRGTDETASWPDTSD